MTKKGKWVKERKEPSDYPKTEQQKKIARSGELISEECSGLEGNEFKKCRVEVFNRVFGDDGKKES